MSAYFHAHNANRRIANVLFEIYDIAGGTALGIYAAENETEIAELRAQAGNPASAVEEITQAQYEDLRKKKAPHLISLPSSQPASQPVAVQAGVVGEGRGEEGRSQRAEDSGQAEEGKSLPRVEDVLAGQEVEAGPEPAPVPKGRKK